MSYFRLTQKEKICLLLTAVVLAGTACRSPAESSGKPSEPATATAPSLPTATQTEEVVPTVEPSPEPTITPTPLPASWQEWPVVPVISERALEIYQQGIAQGRDPYRFSKAGDCQNTSTYFLGEFENPNGYTLGEYGYLQETIDWYTGSFGHNSLAAKAGLNVASVLSPFFADATHCEPGENLIACEVRVFNPSLMLISLDGNWEGRSAEEYEEYMRRIIEELIDLGVLPILATKADNVEGDHSINQTIVSLAVEYDLPLWNFWAAVQPLPNQGLRPGSDFYITIAGPHFDNPINMQSAYPWRNLTALQTLDALLKAIIESEILSG